VVYVWIDALSNYITALGYGTEQDANFQRYWPADVHVIGKDIMWFHTVYWPAMLFALGLEPPKAVVAHGWFMSGGRKMGKTLGNFVDLEMLRKKVADHGLDALRYFLLRGAVFGSDPDWNETDFTKSFNELANVLGNCLNRVVKMVGRYRPALPAVAEPLEEMDRQLIAATEALPGQIESAYEKFELQQCALLPMELLRNTNGYIDSTEPFKLAKDPAKAGRLDTVLNLSAQAIYRALVALLPIIPDKATEGLSQLGVSTQDRTLPDLFAAPLPAGQKLGEATPLFPKLQKPG
jgi:methionyl-tRNA synthetase